MTGKRLWIGAGIAGALLTAALFLSHHGDPQDRDSEMLSHKQASGSPVVSNESENSVGGAGASSTVSAAYANTAAFRSAGSAPMAQSATEGHAKLTLVSMTDSQADRYLIKNAVATIEAKDVHAAVDSVRNLAKSLDGYISNSHESVDNLGLSSETIEIRVPSARFDDAMGAVKSVGRMLDDQVTSEDVTEEYVDTDAQMRNLKETEGRLLEHLSRTGKLSDTLLVETELTRVRQGIDELEGKLRFMSHRVTFSTIALTLKEEAHIEPVAPPESFSLGQVASQAMRSCSATLRTISAAAVWALVWSIFWAPALAAALYLFRRNQVRVQGTAGRR